MIQVVWTLCKGNPLIKNCSLNDTHAILILVFYVHLRQKEKLNICSCLQVVHSSGKTGHNVEYVLKLAAWSRFALPEIIDDHLFQLEEHILSKVNDKHIYQMLSVYISL